VNILCILRAQDCEPTVTQIGDGRFSTGKPGREIYENSYQDHQNDYQYYFIQGPISSVVLKFLNGIHQLAYCSYCNKHFYLYTM